MGIRDAEPNRQLRLLANKIINRFPGFGFIREWNIKIGYVVRQERNRESWVTLLLDVI